MSGAERRDWTVSGMDCAACTLKVTKAVECLPGVSGVKVALMSERLSLDLVGRGPLLLLQLAGLVCLPCHGS